MFHVLLFERKSIVIPPFVSPCIKMTRTTYKCITRVNEVPNESYVPCGKIFANMSQLRGHVHFEHDRTVRILPTIKIFGDWKGT